jgi:type II secretory pathway component PulK
VNTAPDLVIAAMLDTTRDKAAQVIAERVRKPFADKPGFSAAAGRAGLTATGEYDVKSSWFSARIQVAQDDVQLATEALMKRDAAARGATTIIWRRPLF